MQSGAARTAMVSRRVVPRLPVVLDIGKKHDLFRHSGAAVGSIGGGTRNRFRPAAKPIPGSTLRVAPE